MSNGNDEGIKSLRDLDLEKPPSPVLCNKMNRKILWNRKLQRKSRVKLTERFTDNHDQRGNVNETSKISEDEVLMLSPTTSNDHNKTHEEKIQGIGYNHRIVKDFKLKEPKSTITNAKCASFVASDLLKVSEQGFKTAGGNSINLNFSEDILKKSKSLFDDIVNFGEKPEVDSRSNKYSFLSKRNTSVQEKLKYNCIQEQTNSSTEKENLPKQNSKHNFLKPFTSNSIFCKTKSHGSAFGFQKASGIDLCIADSAYKSALKLLEPNLSENNVEEELKENLSMQQCEDYTVNPISTFCAMPKMKPNCIEVKGADVSFQKASGKNLQITDSAFKSACKLLTSFEPNVEIDKSENKDVDLLCSQETNQLFANFTIFENEHFEDTVLGKKEGNDFKGFTADMIQDSCNKFQEFAALIQELTINRKRPSISKVNSNISRKSKPSASGKCLQIADSALKSASKLLSPLESNNALLKSEINKDRQDLDLLSTQETNEWFSNFAIVEGNLVKQSIRKEEEDCWRGFTADMIEKSRNSLKEYMTVISQFTQSKNVHSKGTNVIIKKTNNQFTTLGGFTTAAGNTYQISQSAIAKAHQNFKDLDLTPFVKESSSENMQPSKSSLPNTINRSGKCTLQKEALKGDCFKNAFQTAGGISLHLPPEALKRAKQLYECTDNDLSLEDSTINDDITLQGNCSFGNSNSNTIAQSIPTSTKKKRLGISFGKQSNSSRISSHLSESALKSATPLYDKKFNENDSLIRDGGLQGNISFEDTDSTLIGQRLINKAHKNKRLGILSGKQIAIPKDKIEKAMKIFDDEKLPVMSPLRTNISGVYNSTPLKNANFAPIDSNITPIKTIKSENTNAKNTECILDHRFSVHECTKGTLDSWHAMLENEKKMLEMRLQAIAEKQKGLSLQKHYLERGLETRLMRHSGVLFNEKNKIDRISLQYFVKLNPVSLTGLNITPQNAELVHFNHTQENLSSVTTSDGACIIPNRNNKVGLSEIEIAFKVMPGVDPKLIPNGWIRNHFKWIVWKLASYENFSTNMKNCLTLENVIQQLKYRYDREIDRAERPTLRKIFELDDAPQKRMVLCVSEIFNLENGQFEIQLTDGWYSIRTTIDQALCQQILSHKIQVGTKLITCGAELLNCEGCHPLMCTDMVRLKINSNSTRRTKWYVKLGYQRFPEPFPLRLCSILPSGGLIGCVKILAARVYPVKFMERQNKLTIWRNRKSEELYAQEWENKRQQDLGKIRDTITRDYEMLARDRSRSRNISVSDNEICHIDCPETLFDLYKNSKDPERLQELLSSTQKTAISEYQQRIFFMQQQEMSRKIQDSLSSLQMAKRDVTPVLQLRVIDMLDPNEKAHIFQIWRPSSTHLEIIKESSVFYVYNVVPKKNGDFSTMSRTKFQVIHNDFVEINKYQRRLTRICDIANSNLNNKPFFNEFDTVGIILSLKIEGVMQNLWLADASGRLLFVKIFEGPKNCLLLDNLTIGRLVAVSNLIYCQSKFEFVEAIANHLTIISYYPQQKHLQEGINVLNSELPQNLQMFLKECEEKISYYTVKVGLTKDYRNIASSSLVQSNSLMNSDIFDESSDVLFSMIDLDKFK